MMNKLLHMREAHLLAIKYITARMDAFDAQENKYVGKPCRKGHKSGLRYVKSDCCVECLIERDDRLDAAKTR
jgi:hypothetical protein